MLQSKLNEMIVFVSRDALAGARWMTKLGNRMTSPSRQGNARTSLTWPSVIARYSVRGVALGNST